MRMKGEGKKGCTSEWKVDLELLGQLRSLVS